MSRARSSIWIAAFAAFLCVGIPYWRVPYSDVNLPNALMGPGLVLVGVAAFWVHAAGAASFLKSFLVVGAAVPAAVLARVIVEAVRDPSSHNLWPLEVVIAGVVGLTCALIGASAGGLVRRLKGPTPRKASAR